VTLAADGSSLLDATFIDYLIVALYFGFVLGIGYIARSQISDSLDFFLRVDPRRHGSPGSHLSPQPRRRRDHGHVGQRRAERPYSAGIGCLHVWVMR
jgi:hypothetical protein